MHLTCSLCKRFTERPLACRACGKKTLKESGKGNRSLSDALKKAFPKESIACVEKGETSIPSASVLIATGYYLEALAIPSHPRFGLVAVVCTEELQRPREVTGTEQTIASLLEIAAVSYRSRCPLVLQAWDPLWLRPFVQNPKEALARDREVRKQLLEPPYTPAVAIHEHGTKTVRLLSPRDPLWSTLSTLPDHSVIQQRTWL